MSDLSNSGSAELAELERALAVAMRDMERAHKAAQAASDDRSISPEEVAERLEAHGRAIDRVGAAKRALDDAYALREMSMPPPPHVRGTPEEELAWMAQLQEEEHAAWSRIQEIKAALAAMPEVDTSRLDDPDLPQEEYWRIQEEVLARIDARIPLLLEWEQAEREMKAADAALDRALEALPDEPPDERD